MRKRIFYLLLSISFSILWISVYLLVTFHYLNSDSLFLEFLMNSVFFISQVFFITVFISVLLMRFSNLKTKYRLLIEISVLLLFTLIYALAFNGYSVFVSISDILIITGTIVSGSFVYLLKYFRKNEKDL